MVIGLLRLSPDLQQSYKGNCLECLYVAIYTKCKYIRDEFGILYESICI